MKYDYDSLPSVDDAYYGPSVDTYTKALKDDGQNLKKKERRALYESSLDAQEKQRVYERELADQIALRDEQREYDSYAAQAQRMREAGLNPDLIFGSGGASGSSGSAPIPTPGLESAEQVIPESDSQTFANVMSGIANIGTTAASIVGAVGGVNSLVQSIAAFPSMLKGQQLSNDLAQQQHDFNEQHNPQLIAGQATANDIAQQQKDHNDVMLPLLQKEQRLSLATRELALVGDIASMLSPGLNDDGTPKPFTLDSIGSQLSDLGIADPDGSIAQGVLRYSNSPQMQQLYSDRILAQRDSFARNSESPFEVIKQIYANDLAVRATRSALDRAFSEWSVELNSYILTEDTARNAGQTIANEHAISAAESKFNYDKLMRNINLYGERLQQLDEFRGKVAEIREKVLNHREYKTTGAKSREAILASLAVVDASLANLDADNLYQITDYLSRLYELDFMTPALLDGAHLPGAATMFENRYNMSNFLFHGSYPGSANNPVVSSGASAAFDVLKATLTKRIPKP